jgi:hypothetical protein
MPSIGEDFTQLREAMSSVAAEVPWSRRKKHWPKYIGIGVHTAVVMKRSEMQRCIAAESQPTLRKNMLAICFTLISSLAYSSALKMYICSSETSVNIQRTTRR